MRLPVLVLSRDDTGDMDGYRSRRISRRRRSHLLLRGPGPPVEGSRMSERLVERVSVMVRWRVG